MNRKPINILLVEDNPDHALLTMEVLQDNYVLNEIFVVEDGREALDFLYGQGKYSGEKRPPLPGLILLDIKLPKVDGLEVLQQIKSDPVLKSIPVVMLTTSEREEEVVKSYANGANSYITKPVSFSEFARKVQEVKLYWLLVNTPP